jgi:hypothetical protein
MEHRLMPKQILQAVLVFSFLVSCTSSRQSSSSTIREQEAIDAALETASTSRPEISGPQKEPSNIRAEQITLDEALKKMSKENQPPSGYDPNMIVWLVTMEGLWLNEMDAPGVAITPAPYRHYAVIIDANTGSEIESFLTP